MIGENTSRVVVEVGDVGIVKATVSTVIMVIMGAVEAMVVVAGNTTVPVPETVNHHRREKLREFKLNR